jgi:zinc transporter ZupT
VATEISQYTDSSLYNTEPTDLIIRERNHNLFSTSPRLSFKSNQRCEKACNHHHKQEDVNSVKLIAWMVILGDGLHNFSDGLAIGASYAIGITTGIGTSLAVLCHELPHEIGDFAVLRRAGITLKRALFFNAISGGLCIGGAVVGLMIGSVDILKNWTFLFVAGVFIYISLVDMVF